MLRGRAAGSPGSERPGPLPRPRARGGGAGQPGPRLPARGRLRARGAGVRPGAGREPDVSRSALPARPDLRALGPYGGGHRGPRARAGGAPALRRSPSAPGRVSGREGRPRALDRRAGRGAGAGPRGPGMGDARCGTRVDGRGMAPSALERASAPGPDRAARDRRAARRGAGPAAGRRSPWRRGGTRAGGGGATGLCGPALSARRAARRERQAGRRAPAPARGARTQPALPGGAIARGPGGAGIGRRRRCGSADGARARNPRAVSRPVVLARADALPRRGSRARRGAARAGRHAQSPVRSGPTTPGPRLPRARPVR